MGYKRIEKHNNLLSFCSVQFLAIVFQSKVLSTYLIQCAVNRGTECQKGCGQLLIFYLVIQTVTNYSLNAIFGCLNLELFKPFEVVEDIFLKTTERIAHGSQVTPLQHLLRNSVVRSRIVFHNSINLTVRSGDGPVSRCTVACHCSVPGLFSGK